MLRNCKRMILFLNGVIQITPRVAAELKKHDTILENILINYEPITKMVAA
jgi:hypothetical protein